MTVLGYWEATLERYGDAEDERAAAALSEYDERAVEEWISTHRPARLSEAVAAFRGKPPANRQQAIMDLRQKLGAKGNGFALSLSVAFALYRAPADSCRAVSRALLAGEPVSVSNGRFVTASGEDLGSVS